MTYKTVITNAGLSALAAAQAGGSTVTMTHIVYGDGNGSMIAPDPAQTTLIHEVHRRMINSISNDSTHPEWVVIESTVPQDIGGWWVREIGVILDDGTLFSVASYPEVYKPTIAQSAGRDLYVKMILSVGNAANVTIEVDGSFVTATIDYANALMNDHESKTDPHPQYLTEVEGNQLIVNHESKTDPHPQYWTEVEGNQLIVDHESEIDPHPQYLTEVEGNQKYSLLNHKHNINVKNYFIGGF